MIRTAALHRHRRAAAGAVLAGAVLASGLTPVVLGTTASAAVPLAPPVVTSPSTGTPMKEVVLDWAPVAQASSYVVQVGTNDEWSDEPTVELTTVATRLTLPTWLPHASYVWRVAGVTGKAPGGWSATGAFTRGWATAPSS